MIVRQLLTCALLVALITLALLGIILRLVGLEVTLADGQIIFSLRYADPAPVETPAERPPAPFEWQWRLIDPNHPIF